MNFILRRVEASRRLKALKPEDGTKAVFHRAMALLEQSVGVAGRAVWDGGPELQPERTGLGLMAIRVP